MDLSFHEIIDHANVLALLVADGAREFLARFVPQLDQLAVVAKQDSAVFMADVSGRDQGGDENKDDE